MSLAANMQVLPAAQKAVWGRLRELASRFVLYGGTALALRLGHRQSEDFDLFGDAPVDPDQLVRDLELLRGAAVRQKAANTLSVTLPGEAPVKLSLFGVRLRRVKEPEWTTDGVLRVASLLDIGGCKMAAVQSRAETKDYLDVDALLRAGVTLPEMLGAASAIYGEQFAPLIALKALAWFNDGNLSSLPEPAKQRLRSAAASVTQATDFEPLPGGIVPGAS